MVASATALLLIESSKGLKAGGAYQNCVSNTPKVCVKHLLPL